MANVCYALALLKVKAQTKVNELYLMLSFVQIIQKRAYLSVVHNKLFVDNMKFSLYNSK